MHAFGQQFFCQFMHSRIPLWEALLQHALSKLMWILQEHNQRKLV